MTQYQNNDLAVHISLLSQKPEEVHQDFSSPGVM